MTDISLMIGKLKILLAIRKQRARDTESSPAIDVREFCDNTYLGQLL